jgi:predicted helicase
MKYKHHEIQAPERDALSGQGAPEQKQSGYAEAEEAKLMDAILLQARGNLASARRDYLVALVTLDWIRGIMYDPIGELGNPPYSNFGQLNKSPFILDLLNDYKHGLNEKKLNLDDDFIKFIRFAQWRIEKTGHGIVGFITSNTYLDGITHRRMRESLMQAFDEINILDLHGSSKKKEKTPDGGKDENVFDITVGVSTLLAVRLAETGPHSDGRVPVCVFHTELWGERKGKYDWLWHNEAKTTSWTELSPTERYFFFVPKKFSSQEEYEAYFPVDKVFSAGTSAVQTKRDALFVDFNGERLDLRMRELLEAGPTPQMSGMFSARTYSVTSIF